MKIATNRLRGISETLLFTLYMRYKESVRPGGKITDPRYAQLIERIDFDFSIYDDVPDDFQIGIICRSIIFDSVVRAFITGHPDATVVSLGPGLDFTYERVTNGRIHWFNVDLPEVIRLRRLLYPPVGRMRQIAASVLDFSWMEQIPQNVPVFFLAEGLLVYLPQQDVQALLIRLAETFPGSELILDAYSNFYIRHAKQTATHPFLRRMAALWQWGVDDWQTIEAWHPLIRLIQEYFPYESFGERLPAGFKAFLEDDTLPEGLLDELLKLSRIGHFALGGTVGDVDIAGVESKR
jgi:O-methyltransferase involved in polyketide biosynthesis